MTDLTQFSDATPFALVSSANTSADAVFGKLRLFGSLQDCPERLRHHGSASQQPVWSPRRNVQMLQQFKGPRSPQLRLPARKADALDYHASAHQPPANKLDQFVRHHPRRPNHLKPHVPINTSHDLFPASLVAVASFFVPANLRLAGTRAGSCIQNPQ